MEGLRSYEIELLLDRCTPEESAVHLFMLSYDRCWWLDLEWIEAAESNQRSVTAHSDCASGMKR